MKSARIILGALLWLGTFAGTASAQLPDEGPCADLYQQHEDLMDNAPADAIPFVNRFRAASEDKEQAAKMLNDADLLKSTLSKIHAVAANNAEVLRQYQQGSINVVYTDPTRQTVAQDPVAFIQFQMSDEQTWGAFLQCRLDNIQPSLDLGELGATIAQYIRDAAEVWKNVDGVKEFAEPLALTLEALQAAKTAAGGDVPTTNKAVEQLQAYVAKEQDVLSDLASRSTDDWLVQSGLNSFDRSTIPAAQNYLDAWSKQLSTQQQLIQHIVPLLQSAEKILANPVVNGIRSAQSTLPGLDPIAVGDIITGLNGCSTQIAKIQGRLKEARSVAY